MSPIETIAIVSAVYAVVFLAHRATQNVAEEHDDEAQSRLQNALENGPSLPGAESA